MRVASEDVVAAATHAPVPALPLGAPVAPDLAALMVRPGWMADAPCREYPGVNFLGESAAARRVCGRCLVQEECRAYALENMALVDGDNARGGIWGGLSAWDRKRMRRAS